MSGTVPLPRSVCTCSLRTVAISGGSLRNTSRLVSVVAHHFEKGRKTKVFVCVVSVRRAHKGQNSALLLVSQDSRG